MAELSSFGQMLQNLGNGVHDTGLTIQAAQESKLKMEQAQQQTELLKQQATKQKSDNLVASDALVTKAQQDLAKYADKKDQEAYVMQKLPTINSMRQASGLAPLQPQDLIMGGEGMTAQRKAYNDSYVHTVGVLNDPSTDNAAKFKALTDLEQKLSDNSAGFTDEVLKNKTEALKTLKEQYRDDRNFKQQQDIQQKNIDAADARSQNAISASEDRQDKKTQNTNDQQTTRAIDTAANQMKRDTILNKLTEQNISMDQSEALLDEIKKGNTNAAAAAGIKIAKAMGEVGVMTENDVVRYIQSKKFSQKTQDKIDMFFKGTPSDMTQSEIKDTLDVLKFVMDQKIVPRYRQYIDQIVGNHDISEEEAIKRLGLKSVVQPQGQAPAGGKSTFVFKPKAK